MKRAFKTIGNYVGYVDLIMGYIIVNNYERTRVVNTLKKEKSLLLTKQEAIV